MDIPTIAAPEMRLYDAANQRLYINATERERFALVASGRRPQVASFCLTLLYTGCRVSEALELRSTSVQLESRTITFRTLKRRRPDAHREVPIPAALAHVLRATHRLPDSAERPLWAHAGQPLNRITAYRWVKAVMMEAGIFGAQACPKGLRHGYGIHAVRSGVQLNMLQKWMGHASMTTTAIYANAIGAEELAIADRMWS